MPAQCHPHYLEQHIFVIWINRGKGNKVLWCSSEAWMFNFPWNVPTSFFSQSTTSYRCLSHTQKQTSPHSIHVQNRCTIYKGFVSGKNKNEFNIQWILWAELRGLPLFISQSLCHDFERWEIAVKASQVIKGNWAKRQELTVSVSSPP